MKTITILLLFAALVTQSCHSQSNQSIMLHYKAETRGFSYSLNLTNGVLKEIENGTTKTKNLSTTELNAIEKQLSEINFSKIENNLLSEEIAVDRAIPAYFEVEFNNNKYYFEFSHHNLPKEIAALFNSLKMLKG